MLIKKDTSVDDIEQLYAEANKSPATIQIVNGFKSLRIGLIPRLSQFFITISKKTQIPFQFTWVTMDDDATQKNIIEDPICVTALLMSDRILYGQEKKSLKKLLNAHLVQRFDQSIFKHGRQIQMMAIDHSIEQYAKPDCFYLPASNSVSCRNPSYYFELLKSYFYNAGRVSNFNLSDYEGISELLAELVDNTEQHAKTDFTRGISNNSVRAVVINSHQLMKGQDINRVCGTNNPVADYINAIKEVDKTLHLLEISVFDSGPGIYQSFNISEHSHSLTEEASYLFKSFLNGVTSKPNGIGVGRGLNKARLILNERRGFISIRSGRLSVFRNYDLTPLSMDNEFDSLDIEFFDEITKSKDGYTEMQKVEGVSYTILVPLR